MLQTTHIDLINKEGNLALFWLECIFFTCSWNKLQLQPVRDWNNNTEHLSMSKLDFKCFNKHSIMYLPLTLISIWYKEMSLHADELRISLLFPKISILYLQRLKCCTFPKLNKKWMAGKRREQWVWERLEFFYDIAYRNWKVSISLIIWLKKIKRLAMSVIDNRKSRTK